MVTRGYVQLDQRGDEGTGQYVAGSNATIYAHVLKSGVGEDVLGFPPRERMDPILLGVGNSHRVVGSSKVEINPATVGENGMEKRPKIQVNLTHSNFPIPKLELLMFDELKPRWWIQRCEKLFGIHHAMDEHRVNLAVAYLNDVGDVWFQGWSRVKSEYNWDDFISGLCERFGEKRTMDIVEEFNKMKQNG